MSETKSAKYHILGYPKNQGKTVQPILHSKVNSKEEIQKAVLNAEKDFKNLTGKDHKVFVTDNENDIEVLNYDDGGKLQEMFDIQQNGSFEEKAEFLKNNPEIFAGKIFNKGGITKGKSHAEGGIPMVVKSTGQKVELEGGEGVINKKNMADKKLHNFEGKQMTKCEIASEINSDGGNGVEIDCNGVTGKKYKHETGGQISYGGMGNVFPDLTENQRNQIMDVYMDKYETGGNIKEVLDAHSKIKNQKKHLRKMFKGGVVNEYPTPMIIKVNKAMDIDTYDKTQNYLSTIRLKPNMLYNVEYDSVDTDTNNVRFFINNYRSSYAHSFLLNKEDFIVIDFNSENGLDDLSHYTNYQLDEYDEERIELLTMSDPTKLTIESIEFLSEFKGNNNANYLTSQTIKHLYTLLFEHKSRDVEIGKIMIRNNGVGNITSHAPKYVHCSIYNDAVFDYDELSLENIENAINDIQNYSSDDQTWSYFEGDDILDVDAILLAYPKIDPEADDLAFHLMANKNVKTVGVSIAEFSTSEKRDKFMSIVMRNKLIPNRELNVKFQKVQQGINDGNFTLIVVEQYKF